MVYGEVRGMYVLGILCTDVWKAEVYVWCIESEGVCMCSPYCPPTYVCAGHTVYQRKEMKCIYCVSRGSVYACARHVGRLPTRAQVYLCSRTTVCVLLLLKLCADTSMGWAERDASERVLVDDDRAAQV